MSAVFCPYEMLTIPFIPIHPFALLYLYRTLDFSVSLFASVVDPHHFALMGIRIRLITLMRIRILIFI
jgi:hypothetical protein